MCKNPRKPSRIEYAFIDNQYVITYTKEVQMRVEIPYIWFMFTGINIELGKVRKKDYSRFIFQADSTFCKKLSVGVTVAVNGVQLFVTEKPTETSFAVELLPETAQRTMLGKLNENDPINLEIPITVETLLSGHLLLGLIEGTGRVAATKNEEKIHTYTIAVSEKISDYIIEKGYIGVNGISANIAKAQSTYFTFIIPPFLWPKTTFTKTKVNDLVNIETDFLARYVEKSILRQENEKEH